MARCGVTGRLSLSSSARHMHRDVIAWMIKRLYYRSKSWATCCRVVPSINCQDYPGSGTRSSIVDCLLPRGPRARFGIVLFFDHGETFTVIQRGRCCNFVIPYLRSLEKSCVLCCAWVVSARKMPWNSIHRMKLRFWIQRFILWLRTINRVLFR